MRADQVQDDLTDSDELVVNTEKIFEADDGVAQPSQDPNWIPEGSA